MPRGPARRHTFRWPCNRETTSATQLLAQIGDAVAEALEELPDLVGAHLAGLLETVDGGLRAVLQFVARPFGSALQAGARLLEPVGRILARFLGLFGGRVPGLGERVVDLGERLLQLVSRLHRALLDLSAQLAQLVTCLHHAVLGVLGDLAPLFFHVGCRLLDVLGRLVHVTFDERLVGIGHALVGLRREIARGLRVDRRDGGHQRSDEEALRTDEPLLVIWFVLHWYGCRTARRYGSRTRSRVRLRPQPQSLCASDLLPKVLNGWGRDFTARN